MRLRYPRKKGARLIQRAVFGKNCETSEKSSRPLSPGMSKEEQEYERQKQLKKLKAKRRASSSLLGIGNPDHRYDGKHSEGNRFITNNDL